MITLYLPMRKRLFCFAASFFLLLSFLFSQTSVNLINDSEARRVISVLASDSLRGRGNGSPDLLKAGLFIGEKFKQAGLQYLTGQLGYYVPFRLFGGSAIPDILEWNDKPVSSDRFMFINPIPGNYRTKKLSDFNIVHLESEFSGQILKSYSSSPKDLLLWTSVKQPGGENFFPEKINIPTGGIQHSFLLVYAEEKPDSLTLTAVESYYSALEYNVVGVLPGKSKPNEVIIFSAHYDHKGINLYEKKDTIMNGANDDASGVTATLMLADYFSRQGNNERTIIFCTFAGEEPGLVGSGQMVDIFDTKKIVAVVNIEMIGIPQYGLNAVFITGTQYSSLPSILKKNLKDVNIKTKPEPDLKKRLFQRSDNFPFALKEIPAHTIMCSDDSDPCYHRPCDEVRRIDIANMTRIIRGIAVAAESLISGKETPTRVKVEDLR
jgi:hypothetical protein